MYRTVHLLFAAFMWLAASSAVHAQCNGRWIVGLEQIPPGLNGTVFASLRLPNGDLVVGGSFNSPSAGGIPMNGIARWDGARWLSLGNGLQIGTNAGRVNSLALLPNGNIVAGGEFTNSGTVSVVRIARWNGSNWSALGAGFNGDVNALAVLPNGQLIAGGSFTAAGGVSVNRVARWTGSAWGALGLGVSSFVNALAVMPNGNLIVGGEFLTAGGVQAQGIAQWNGSSWSAIGQLTGAASVASLAVAPNGDLIAGGRFTGVGGVTANNIARWNGTTWAALGTGIDGGANTYVRALAAMSNGDIVAGGIFTLNSGVGLIEDLARWNGTSWSEIGEGVVGPIFSLTASTNGEFFIGGEIGQAGLLEVRNIARWNGSSWNTLGKGLSGEVNAVTTMPSGAVIAAGWFTTAGGLRANGIVRWDGTSWSPLGTGLTGSPSLPSSLAALPNGDLIVGGDFLEAGGVTASRIARWNGASWSPLGLGMNGSVLALAALPSGEFFAGGTFTTAGGAPAFRIARWGGTTWSPLGLSPGCCVYALIVLPNGDLVAGGSFISAGGVTVNRIARWNGSAWAPFGSGMNAPVHSLAVLPNGHLVAGGEFTGAGGVPVNRIARWDGASWHPLGSGVTHWSDCAVYALKVLPNGSLIAGGDFTTAGSVSVNCIARWNGSTWSALGSGLNSAGDFASVRSITLPPGGELVVGGTFTHAGNLPSSRFARWTETGVPWVAQQPAGQSGDAGQTLTLTAKCASGYDFAGAVTFQWQRDGVDIANGASKDGGVVSGASGVLNAVTLSTTLTITGARPCDSGEYTVVFTNSCGSVTSGAALVDVSGGCAADLDGSGVVDGDDLALLLGSWGESGGDLNGDGTTDSADLCEVLAAWGACG